MHAFFEYNFNIEKITLACFVPPGGGALVHQNRPQHGLAFFADGNRCFTFGDKKIVVGKNEILYMPKHADYTISNTKNDGCFAINFDLTEEVQFPPFSVKVKNPVHYLTCFRNAEQAWRAQFPDAEMECKANLYSILCALSKESRLAYISKSNSEIIRPAITYMHENYTGDNISIEKLARLCGISETYFRSIFSKVKGISPLKYINNLKLSHAMELIASGMYSISEAALLSGFHDEAYFSRTFKKATGRTPSAFLQENS